MNKLVHIECSEWPLKAQSILGEVLPFREIDPRTGIAKRPHKRSRSFPGGGENLDLGNTRKAGNGG